MVQRGIQSGLRDKTILGLTRVPYDLGARWRSFIFRGDPGPFQALVSYLPDLMAVA